MIPVAVHGAEGRMGRLVTNLVDEAPGFKLSGLISEPGRSEPRGGFHPHLPLLGQDQFVEGVPAGTVLVDFSLPAALPGLLAGGKVQHCPLVVGTTGFSGDQIESLRHYAESFPVVHASNFSIGIPALRMLIQMLGRTLPPGFDAEEVEVHHRFKVDRPSGTALDLARAYQETRGGDLPPVHSLRMGGIYGEHTWNFSDQEETLVLTHRAHSRQAFLRGILPAVAFVAAAQPGYYDLQDVLMAKMGDRKA